MRVDEIMTSPVVAVTTAATPAEAAEVLHRCGFTTLPVLDHRGRLVGLLSESDVARYYLEEAHRATAPDDGAMLHGRRTAGELMHSPATAVGPDTTVADAATAMLGSAQRCLPVVDRGRVVGILSWRDVLRQILAPMTTRS